MKELFKCHICKEYFDPKKTKVTIVRAQFKDGKLTMLVCPWCAKNLIRFTGTQQGGVARVRKINDRRSMS